jgi:hypothetical protein
LFKPTNSEFGKKEAFFILVHTYSSYRHVHKIAFSLPKFIAIICFTQHIFTFMVPVVMNESKSEATRNRDAIRHKGSGC